MGMKSAWKRDAIETFESLGGKIKGRVVYDEDLPNPRKDYDNQTIFICSHRRYSLGDVSYHDKTHSEIYESIWLESASDMECAEVVDLILGTMGADRANTIRADFEGAPARNLFEYLLHHGWSCDKVRESLPECFVSLPLFLMDHSGLSISTGAFGCTWDSGRVGVALAKTADFPSVEAARAAIRNEVETYDGYLRGEAYRWELWDTRDDSEDSCSGYDTIESARVDLLATMAHLARGADSIEAVGQGASDSGLFNN